jgi:hypothetical protein
MIRAVYLSKAVDPSSGPSFYLVLCCDGCMKPHTPAHPLYAMLRDADAIMLSSGGESLPAVVLCGACWERDDTFERFRVAGDKLAGLAVHGDILEDLKINADDMGSNTAWIDAFAEKAPPVRAYDPAKIRAALKDNV